MTNTTEPTTSSLIHSIPRDLHKRFRVALLENDETLQDVFLRLVIRGMEEYIQRNEKEKGR